MRVLLASKNRVAEVFGGKPPFRIECGVETADAVQDSATIV